MSIINVTTRGSFDNTERFLHNIDSSKIGSILEKYGPIGVKALSEATPVDTGLAARSWYYEVINKPGYSSLRWHNNDIEGGIPVVILLQYGHGTRNGGWVEGRDFIMPAIQPVFEQIMAEVTKEVTK
jgi:hypothetical protein